MTAIVSLDDPQAAIAAAPPLPTCRRTLPSLALQRDPAAILAYVACVRRRMGLD